VRERADRFRRAFALEGFAHRLACAVFTVTPERISRTLAASDPCDPTAARRK